jgi:uncharacterized protein YlxW (UPF0749 family)
MTDPSPPENERPENEPSDGEPAVGEPAVGEPAVGDPAGGGLADDELSAGPTALDEPDRAQPGEPSKRFPRSSGGHRRAAALIGVLLALLGFGIAVQVRSNSSSDSLSSARDDDLIRILDDQDSRADRLRQQIAQLQATEQELQASGDRDSVALRQAQQQEQALGVLLGTLPATGPGIAITITDPQHGLKAEDLLDVVEELRGAGAEAIQFGSVRVATSTAFVDDSGGGIDVDGHSVKAPYTVLAIGDPQTLDTAMQIPGGVAATARAAGGNAAIVQQPAVTIRVVRAIANPHYAKPVGR